MTNETGWNHRHVNANGITIHYVRHGEGHPLVMLHGWPEFWYVWRKNIPVLAENFEVVVPDPRGFGDSDKPGAPPELPKIETPTRVRWGEGDPVLKVQWADLANREISDFFEKPT